MLKKSTLAVFDSQNSFYSVNNDIFSFITLDISKYNNIVKKLVSKLTSLDHMNVNTTFKDGTSIARGNVGKIILKNRAKLSYTETTNK